MAAGADRHQTPDTYAAARQFSEISSPFRINLPQPHGILVRHSFAQFLVKLFDVNPSNSRKNTLWDIDHLHGHYVAQRDYFLTNEERIIRKRPFLGQVGVQVARPDRFVEAFLQVEQAGSLTDEDFRAQLANLIDQRHNIRVDPKYRKLKQTVVEDYQRALAEGAIHGDTADGLSRWIEELCIMRS